MGEYQVWAGLGSFWEVRGNLFPPLFWFLEAAHIPWLGAPSSHCSGLCFHLFLPETPLPPSCEDPEMTWDDRGRSSRLRPICGVPSAV